MLVAERCHAASALLHFNFRVVDEAMSPRTGQNVGTRRLAHYRRPEFLVETIDDERLT